jgi:hypothetical protein
MRNLPIAVFVLIWVMHENRWRLVAAHVTPVSAKQPDPRRDPQ